jgi:hypothetical protein
MAASARADGRPRMAARPIGPGCGALLSTAQTRREAPPSSRIEGWTAGGRRATFSMASDFRGVGDETDGPPFSLAAARLLLHGDGAADGRAALIAAAATSWSPKTHALFSVAAKAGSLSEIASSAATHTSRVASTPNPSEPAARRARALARLAPRGPWRPGARRSLSRRVGVDGVPPWGCYGPRSPTSRATGNRVGGLCGDQKGVFRSTLGPPSIPGYYADRFSTSDRQPDQNCPIWVLPDRFFESITGVTHDARLRLRATFVGGSCALRSWPACYA